MKTIFKTPTPFVNNFLWISRVRGPSTGPQRGQGCAPGERGGFAPPAFGPAPQQPPISNAGEVFGSPPAMPRTAPGRADRPPRHERTPGKGRASPRMKKRPKRPIIRVLACRVPGGVKHRAASRLVSGGDASIPRPIAGKHFPRTRSVPQSDHLQGAGFTWSRSHEPRRDPGHAAQLCRRS